MSKILILGDSFADVGAKHYHQYEPWAKILARLIGDDIVNMAVGGSSLYYAYQLFEQYQKDFERIILVETNSGRKYKHIPALDHTLHKSSCHFTQAVYNNNLWKQKLDKSNSDYLAGLKTLEAIESFYLYVYDYNEYELYHQLMLEQIKRIRPDIIVVPAFKNVYQTYTVLSDISDLELEHYGLTYLDMHSDNGRVDLRRCHMSKENNEILAHKMVQWLDGLPVTIDLKDFKKPTEDVDLYLPLRKNYNKIWNLT